MTMAAAYIHAFSLPVCEYVCLRVCILEGECVYTIHMCIPATQLMMSTSQRVSNNTAELMREFLFLHPAFISRWDSIPTVHIGS